MSTRSDNLVAEVGPVTITIECLGVKRSIIIPRAKAISFSAVPETVWIPMDRVIPPVVDRVELSISVDVLRHPKNDVLYTIKEDHQ